MNIAEVKKNAEQKMNKSVESLKADLAKVRTGRAHTAFSTIFKSIITVLLPRSARSPMSL